MKPMQYLTSAALCFVQSLLADESFQHILRVLNTNVDGKQKIMFAMTSIKGIGRRFANIACKKAEVDMRKRCGAASEPCSTDSIAKGLAVFSESTEQQSRCCAVFRDPAGRGCWADKCCAARCAGRARCQRRSWSS